jgi:hypothetical protein
MSPLKKTIFAEIRKIDKELNLLNEDALNKIVFYHPNNLRLSPEGYGVVRRIFTPYSFEIPITIKTKHQLGMSRLQFPYYFTKRRLVLFSEVDDMVVKLQGGIEQFLESCLSFSQV